MRRVALALLAAAAWITGTTLGVAAHPEPAAAQPLFELGMAHAGFVPTLDGTQPMFILLVGSGARPGDDVEHSLADSIHIVAINPAKHKASILGIPRDSWVDIPGHGSNKINAAMFYGGPPLLVQTVEALTHIRLDYWALTTFWGFSAMVNQVGGLSVDVPFSMHDYYSHSDFNPGVQKLNGNEALAFARDRHSLPEGDFGRSEDAGRLMLASLAQFRKEFTKDPSRVFSWIAAGVKNVESEVPLDQILALAFTVTKIDPKHVENVVAPGTTGSIGNISTVNLTSEAQVLFADLARDGIVSKKNLPPSPNASLLGGG